MNIFEKFYSLLAVIFAVGLVLGLSLHPELRQFHRLLPVSLLGLAVNIGLMFIVLKDIFLRHFTDKNAKFLWLGLVLIFWPSIIYYLFRYGFKSRPAQ